MPSGLLETMSLEVKGMIRLCDGVLDLCSYVLPGLHAYCLSRLTTVPCNQEVTNVTFSLALLLTSGDLLGAAAMLQHAETQSHCSILLRRGLVAA